MDLARQLCFNIMNKAHTEKTQTKGLVSNFVKFINNSEELQPINRQYLSHMCTSVNPNTNQLQLMNN